MADGGFRPAFNAQLAVDTATLIITGVDLINSGSDMNQMLPMHEQHQDRYEGVRQFLELAPNSEYVNIASAGHMVAGDRNDTFGKAVVEFLTRVVPVAGAMLPPRQRAELIDRLNATGLNDMP